MLFYPLRSVGGVVKDKMHNGAQFSVCPGRRLFIRTFFANFCQLERCGQLGQLMVVSERAITLQALTKLPAVRTLRKEGTGWSRDAGRAVLHAALNIARPEGFKSLEN